MNGREKNAENVRTDRNWCDEAINSAWGGTSCCGENQTRNEVEPAWICGVWFSSLANLVGVSNYVVKCSFSLHVLILLM